MQTFLHRIGAVAFLLGIGVLAGAVVAWFCGAGMSVLMEVIGLLLLVGGMAQYLFFRIKSITDGIDRAIVVGGLHASLDKAGFARVPWRGEQGMFSGFGWPRPATMLVAIATVAVGAAIGLYPSRPQMKLYFEAVSRGESRIRIDDPHTLAFASSLVEQKTGHRDVIGIYIYGRGYIIFDVPRNARSRGLPRGVEKQAVSWMYRNGRLSHFINAPRDDDVFSLDDVDWEPVMASVGTLTRELRARDYTLSGAPLVFVRDHDATWRPRRGLLVEVSYNASARGAASRKLVYTMKPDGTDVQLYR